MLDHIGLRVSDVAAAQAFYDATLAPLGIAVVFSVSAAETGTQAYLGYGSEGRPYFWIGAGETSTRVLHVAFTADSRAKVDAFYAAAMAAAARTTARPASAPTITPTTTAPSCSMRTATTSRPSAICKPRLVRVHKALFLLASEWVWGCVTAVAAGFPQWRARQWPAEDCGARWFVPTIGSPDGSSRRTRSSGRSEPSEEGEVVGDD